MEFKKILYPLFSLFLAYRSYELVCTVWDLGNVSLTIKILIAALLNLFITGVFAFVGFAYNTSRILPDGYYTIKSPKLLLRVSSVLKLSLFKKFLLVFFWGRQKNRKKYFNGSKHGLLHFDSQTRRSEFGHLLPMVIIQMVVVMMLFKAHYLLAFVTTLVNIVFNFYPVVLQRNHRLRISRLQRN